jgi:hypothetical protein
VLWKQESFVVLRPLQIEFFRTLLGTVGWLASMRHWHLRFAFDASSWENLVNRVIGNNAAVNSGQKLSQIVSP